MSTSHESTRGRWTALFLVVWSSGQLVGIAFAQQLPEVAAEGWDEPHDEGLALLNEWVEQRVENARLGQVELVSFPLTFRDYWACNCPDYYLGIDPDTGFGEPWIRPIPVGGVELPVEPEEYIGYRGEVVYVQGYFTGETRDQYVNPEVPEPIFDFTVVRSRRFNGTRAADAMARVLLSAEETREKIEPFADVRAWLVVSASYAREDREPQARADALVAELRTAGFADAETFDSRRAPGLFCCFYTVVAGRYATSEEAETILERVEESGFDGYVRRGW